jgi:hypothetical protein
MMRKAGCASLSRPTVLLARGYQPGPLIKEMLDRLLEARLNEKVKSRTEERDFIRRYFGPA